MYQLIGFAVVFAVDVRDREVQRAGELAAGPMQGVKTRAATGILAGHLANDNLRIGEDPQSLRVKYQGVLQGFQQSHVLGHVIVLVADPFGDPDLLSICRLHYYANARWAGIAVRAAVNVGNKNRQRHSLI